MITKTISISPDATFQDLSQLILRDFYEMPTIHQGHFDNLKFESKNFRVWVSRQSPADYAGDWEAHHNNRLTIEQLINGCWTVLDKYGRVKK